MLARAIDRGRLHHGLVLSGPAGVGKSRLALALARALLCETQPGRGCGECTICRRIGEGRHTDVAWLRGEGKSGRVRVQAAREVIASTQGAPFEGRAHLVLIDPADRMMDQAANALLKTFEEPRPGVHYVLLTENPGDLLPTVRSRCTSIALGPLDPEDLRAAVDAAVDQREIEVEPATLRTALELADGRPGRALELIEDPSLPALRQLLREVLRASGAQARAQLYSGDGGALWASWKEAVTTSVDPELLPAPEAEPAVIKGGRASKKKRKSKAKAPPVWGTPFQQRRTLARLTELWLVHLRQRMRGAAGLVEDTNTLAPDDFVRQVRVVQGLESSIVRNPNVRLALEQAIATAAGSLPA